MKWIEWERDSARKKAMKTWTHKYVKSEEWWDYEKENMQANKQMEILEGWMVKSEWNWMT